MRVSAQVDKVNPKARLLSVSKKILDSGLQFDWPGFMISAKTGDGVGDMRRYTTYV